MRGPDNYLHLRVDALAGSTIQNVAHRMVMLARQLHVVVEMKFNAVELIAYPDHVSGDALAEAYNQAAQAWFERGEPPNYTPMAFSDGRHIP